MMRPLRRLATTTSFLIALVASSQINAQEAATIKRATQLRASPGDAGGSVASLSVNATVVRTEQRQGAWVQVRTDAGMLGWVHMFDIGAPARPVQDAAANALRGLNRNAGGTGSVTAATATVGIRGLGEGDVARVPGIGSAGRALAPETLIRQLERAGSSAEEAAAFARAAGLQARAVEALPGAAAFVPEAANNAGEPLAALLQSPHSVSAAQEAILGRQIASQLLSDKPLDPTPEVQRYVNRLGRWIALQSPRPAIPWVFAVVDESDFRAFSAPGGMVFITRGLLDRCEDEAELAGILAHEIVHVAYRHHLQAMHAAAQGTAQGVKIAPNLTALAHYVYATGNGAVAEHAADREAVVLAAKAGLDPYGLLSSLVQLNTLGDSDLAYADVHPPSRIRLDQLEQAMGQRLDTLAGTKAAVSIDQRLAQFK